MSRLVRVEYEDRIEALKRTVIPQSNTVGNTLLKFIKGQGIPKREERILVEMNLLEYVDQATIKKEDINWNLVGFPQAVTISRLGIEYLEHITTMNTNKKEQKELLTEIMNEDQKDGLYDTDTRRQTAVDYLEDILFTLWEDGHIALHDNTKMKEIFKQARQREQNQIRTAYQVGLYDSSMPRNERFDNGLDYYNQTYRQ